MNVGVSVQLLLRHMDCGRCQANRSLTFAARKILAADCECERQRAVSRVTVTSAELGSSRT